jgi:hypothetical protein
MLQQSLFLVHACPLEVQGNTQTNAAGSQVPGEQHGTIALHDPPAVAHPEPTPESSCVKSTATDAVPLRTITRVTATGGLTRTFAVAGAVLTQFGEGAIMPDAATPAQLDPNAAAVNVTCPRGRPLMDSTVLDPAMTSKLFVTERAPSAAI